MWLTAATPLSVVFFIAFVLLLLSTLSTPIIHNIPLGSYKDVNLGVFGYCRGATCSPFTVGYSTDAIFANEDDFEVPEPTRHALSAILIIHPIATLFALICLGLAVATHFRGPSHSPRYLLGLLIFTVPTLLASLLAFLVDILLFIPHMAWGGWIVLGATILIVASSVMTCAMRRTLVSRKARKRRIAENAEMNGANYYDNMNQHTLMADEFDRADSPPPINENTALGDKGTPQFATFEMKRQEARSGEHGRVSEDQTPLTAARDPSLRSTTSSNGRRGYAVAEDPPPMPMNGRPHPRRPSRDQFGNPISYDDLPPPGLRHQGSHGSLGSNHSDGYGRARGGYGPPPRGRGRGYGPPRGGPYGPMGPSRGGYPPRGGFRGGPPPPGWNGRGRGGYGPPPNRGRGGYPRAGPPPGYGNTHDDYSSTSQYGYTQSPVQSTDMPPQQPSHDEFVAGPVGAIGQAIEMDERNGQLSPSNSHSFRDSDVQHHQHAGLQVPQRNGSDPTSPTSSYSLEQAYVPPRAQWEQTSPTETSTAHAVNTLPPTHNEAPQSTHKRGGSEAYYEDVDPRFAVDPASDVGVPSALTPGPRMMSPHHLQPSSHIPSYGSTDDSANRTSSLEQQARLNGSEEQLPEGARSPGESSEASHFTSVSQRGINPNWRPSITEAPAQAPRQQDEILNANPDFTIPGMAKGRGKPQPRGGMMSMGSTPSGRYPAAI